jgi:predicted lipoprotein with Yx(FWY)xxD motif
MFRRRSIFTYVSGGAVIAALALSACGGDDDSSSSSGSTTTSSEGSSAQSSTVVVNKTDLGSILADGKDQTLYLFLKDTGKTSECNDACASAWPPLTVSGKPTAGSGAETSLVGTTTRSDGKTTGHVQRPPGPSLLGRPEGRRHGGRGTERVRRQLVRGLSGRGPGHRHGIQLEWLGRR